MIDRLLQVVRDQERAVLFTVVEGDGIGTKLLVLDGGETTGDGPPELAAEAQELLRGHKNQLLEMPSRKVFAELYGPPPTLVIYGAVDTAEALCALARPLGWRTVVGDARAAFLTRERIPSADELIVGWPDEVLAKVQPDFTTAIVVLTHDDKFDVPLAAGGARDGGALHRRARAPAATRSAAARGCSRRGWPRRSSRASTALRASTSAAARPPRRRSRSWPRSSPCARAAPAAACARPRAA